MEGNEQGFGAETLEERTAHLVVDTQLAFLYSPGPFVQGVLLPGLSYIN